MPSWTYLSQLHGPKVLLQVQNTVLPKQLLTPHSIADYSLAHLLGHLLAHSLAHSLAHWLAHSVAHLLAHSLAQSLAYLLHLLAGLLTHSVLAHLFLCRLLTYALPHSVTHAKLM